MCPPPRATGRAAALLFAALTSGCAGLLRETAPSGLPRVEDDLRRRLAAGELEGALAAVGPGGDVDPGDELLALMFRGLVAHYAGRYAESSEAIAAAEAIAEDRYTKSVSRALLSLVAGERVLAYDPEPTERLLLHYYDALNYLRSGERAEAAVAARRLSHLLDLYAERPATERELRARAFLRLFAGAVFEATGEANDAAVAYRLAARAGADLPAAPGATLAAAGEVGGLPEGDVLVVVETGFVAHRAEQSLHLLLWPHELEAFGSGGPALRLSASTCLAEHLLGAPGLADGAGRARAPDVPAALTASLGPLDPATRERCVPLSPPRRAAAPGGRDRAGQDGGQGKEDGPAAPAAAPAPKRSADRREEENDDGAALPRLIRIAWPVYRREGEMHAPIRVRSGDGREASLAFSADLSDAVIAEFESGATTRFVTSLARTALKYGAARALEQEAREEDDTLGDVVGVLADVGSALLERADLRAWHLLPDEIGVVRLRLPAGTHDLALLVGSPGGARRVDLGAVAVRAGALEVVSARVWSARPAVGPLPETR